MSNILGLPKTQTFKLQYSKYRKAKCIVFFQKVHNCKDDQTKENIKNRDITIKQTELLEMEHTCLQMKI